MGKQKPSYDEAIEQLAQILSLDDDAILMAQGYSVLPDRMKRHVKLVIDDYISSHHEALRTAYNAVSLSDQLRFNDVVERAQRRARDSRPPEGL